VARTRFRPDRGLAGRMVVTMLLLALLYVALAFALYWFFGNSAGFLIWGVLPIGMLWAQWYFSDTLAMKGMRAREVTPAEAPELHALVDRLCALADMKKPRVAVSVSDVPNAFATGRSDDRAVVAVTTGALRLLDEREMEAVLSHELSHVAHRDVTVMTVASAVGVIAGFMIRSAMWSSVGRRDQSSAAAFLVFTLIGVVVYAVSFLLTRVLSRYRELSADRAGAILTGQPAALASALTKIAGDQARIPSRDLRAAEPYNAFFIFPAFTSKGFDLGSLFSTHPPLDKRLDQLAKISAELGRPM
jgi:heat shock protein HtpX